MRAHHLTSILRVAAEQDEVFSYFSDARNLEQITPPWLRFEILTPDPLIMRVGATIDYRLRIRGLPVRWQTEISEWQPPHSFVDEQRRGPYRLWHHQHTFVAVDGGTEIRDEVRYLAPGWFLEPLINRLFVRPDVDRIFAYRREQLLAKFGELQPVKAVG